MTIRSVLMWYLGALVVIGGSGTAGYSALKQHRALLETQVAALPTPQVTEEPPAPPPAAPAPVATAAAQAPAVAPTLHHPSPAPLALARAAVPPLSRPWPTLPKAVAADNGSRRHTPTLVVASSHRPSVHANSSHRPTLYAAAHGPTAPHVTYYAYPGYYPYQPNYAYYSYYARYPYYSAY
jgi:hypothetical protein